MMTHGLRKTLMMAIAAAMVASLLVTTGCASGSGSTRTKTYYNPGYRGIGGRSSWGRYPDYIGVGGGIDSGPTPGAVQLPEMGMPDAGSMDVGGFDF